MPEPVPWASERGENAAWEKALVTARQGRAGEKGDSFNILLDGNCPLESPIGVCDSLVGLRVYRKGR